MITIGIYALTGREVSTATVAAILTVLGYSIYDTIIVFDRIRENVPLMRRASFRVIGNVSMWEVLPRSLATTFITLLPVASLYFFGGDTLKDFAFALLVGIGSGAYSSIFLAAPLVAALKEREPEFARRRDDLGALAGVASVGGTLAAEAEEVAAASADESDEEAESDGAPRRPVRRPSRLRRWAVRPPRSESDGASGARRDLTVVPASERGPLETLSLAGVGAVALVAQHADELASEIASRIGVERDEVRAVIADVLDSWRREATRLGESGGKHGGEGGLGARRGLARRRQRPRAPRRADRAPAETARTRRDVVAAPLVLQFRAWRRRTIARRGTSDVSPRSRRWPRATDSATSCGEIDWAISSRVTRTARSRPRPIAAGASGRCSTSSARPS